MSFASGQVRKNSGLVQELARCYAVEKGLLALFVFGLPPLVHIDDPVRACRAGVQMMAALAQLDVVGRVASLRQFAAVVSCTAAV